MGGWKSLIKKVSKRGTAHGKELVDCTGENHVQRDQAQTKNGARSLNDTAIAYGHPGQPQLPPIRLWQLAGLEFQLQLLHSFILCVPSYAFLDALVYPLVSTGTIRT